IKVGETFYDPFCGSGGLLLESSIIGAHTLGSDLDYRAVRSSVINMRSLGARNYSLFIGDSRFLPVKKVDAIATDPPYAIQSSTHGKTIKDLAFEFLSETQKILKNEGYIVFCLPKKHEPEKIVEKIQGLKIQKIIDTRIHRSLTRRILVMVKTNA
ncbi:MAG: TRM11 family SAM-dependent methyltransferase, partial [Candidatus Heimdallarchaeaceae archaeon]